MKKLLFIIGISFISIKGFSQKSDFLKYPKIGIGTNFGSKYLKADVSYMLFKDDLFYPIGNQPYDGLLNDHMFAGIELNAFPEMLAGPMIGYELNLLILQLKGTILSQHDFKTENNLILRPEIGLTLIGMVSLDYGFNWTVLNNNHNLLGKHQLSLSCNLGW